MNAPDPALVELVAGRLEALRRRIAAAGRDGVRIVAVTKRHPPEVVRAAAAVGLVDVGENYAQELVAKADATADLDLRWHMIGQLQTNKVRALAGRVALYQTVDRPSLVRELARRDAGAAILVQVDLAAVGGGRGGCRWEDAEGLVADAAGAGLDVRGLMGVAPPRDGPGGPGAVRVAFDRLAALRGQLALDELSIGMSGDLDEALAAGATMVRLGTALFGPRAAG